MSSTNNIQSRRASAAEKGNKIDHPPSFYEADVKKYIEKFGPAIQERKSQKLVMKQNYKQEYSKFNHDTVMPLSNFKKRNNMKRPPSRHSNTNHSVCDLDYKGNTSCVSY